MTSRMGEYASAWVTGGRVCAGAILRWPQNSRYGCSKSRVRWRERTKSRGIGMLESTQSLLVLLELARVVNNQVAAIISCLKGFLSKISVKKICLLWGNVVL